MLVEVVYDECIFVGSSCEEIIRRMKILDWENPQTIMQFKSNVQSRCLVFNEIILFHDAQSFLEACLEVGIISSLIIDEDYEPVSSKLKHLRL
tara:strand:- start:167 stop:445 length:279 start_codon:yes stop_codon:yes gene_type:complete